jgi:light-regulated signal transduction histidine kinase (bacteriophytochrome)
MFRESSVGKRGLEPMTISILLTLGIFMVDVFTARGYAEGMLYVAPVMVSLWLPQQRATLITAGLCSILLFIGFFISPQGADLSIALANRAMAFVVIGATAYLCIQRRQVKQELQQARDEMEQQVERRTAQLSEINARLEEEVQERRRAEQELLRSNSQLEQFAYVVSHDLQEPLRAVKSYVELIQRRYEEKLNSVGREFVGYAIEGAQRMQSLIGGLLEFSRVGTRGQPFATTECNMVVESALANLRVAIEESGAVVNHDPLPKVNADELQLIRLFQNLIGNAIKFRGSQTPQVQISAEKTEEMWRFAFRDNGIGIESQHAETIFLISRRLHSREEYPGDGIGLAVCKQIVERHGGKIWVEAAPDQGSVFYFTLPVDTNNQPAGA